MCKRGDIYFVVLPTQTNNSSIQAGVRPVVIVQNDIGNRYSPTMIGVPLTSVIKNESQPTHVIIQKEVGLDRTSMVLAEQVLTINKFDIRGTKVCTLPEHIMNKIDAALRISLAINKEQLKEQPDEEYIQSIIRDIHQTDRDIKTSERDKQLMLKGAKQGLIRVLKRYCDRFEINYTDYYTENENNKYTQISREMVV